jgi:hypothetical protein
MKRVLLHKKLAILIVVVIIEKQPRSHKYFQPLRGTYSKHRA